MNVSILGSGNWGTTLAILFAHSGHKLMLWSRSDRTVRELKETRENSRYLPRFKLPDAIEITHLIERAVESADVIFLAIPVQQLRQVLVPLQGMVRGKLLVNLAKGIEQKSRARVSEVCAEELKPFDVSYYAVLSGPTIALEIAMGQPASAVVASAESKTAVAIQESFSSPLFRLYTSDDVCGVELAGAIKNVIAIAAGICDGIGLGVNTKGALLSRGLAEMTRLAEVLGGQRKTLFGLAGMGDLVTTSFSSYSRNRTVGEQIGQGATLSQVLEQSVMVAEGVWTAQAALDLAEVYQIELPLTRAVCDVLFHNKPASTAVQELMMRSLKPES